MASSENHVPKRSAPHVLLAEDNPVNAIVLSKQLAALGYASTVASDGEAAWVALKRGCFVALLTDCEMPILDGYGLAMRVRSEEAFAHLPIIALSARPDQAQMARCRQAGMDACLGKPVSNEKLAAALARPHWDAKGPHASSESDGLAALQRLYPDGKALMDVLRAFVHTTSADLVELDRLYATPTPLQIGKVFHRLIGSLQLLNQPNLARDLDHWYRHGAVPPPLEYRRLHSEVAAQVERARAWIQQLPNS